MTEDFPELPLYEGADTHLKPGRVAFLYAGAWRDRHPGTMHFRPLFAYEHLPEGDMRDVSARMADAATAMVDALDDGPELSAGLRDLLKAKDAFVRQAGLDSGKIR